MVGALRQQTIQVMCYLPVGVLQCLLSLFICLVVVCHQSLSNRRFAHQAGPYQRVQDWGDATQVPTPDRYQGSL